MKDTWQIGGHAPGLTDLEGPLEPRRRLGELAVEHAGKCNQPRKPHGLEGLIKRWRGAEPKVIVLSSKVCKGTPSPPPDRLAQLLQRVGVADGACVREHDAEDVIVEGDPAKGDALEVPGAFGSG